MRIADLLTAVILALGGGLVVYDSVRLGIGWGSDGPRSGFFPFWLAVIMIVACVAIMLQALRRTPTEPFLTRERLGPVLKVLWPATAAVVLMQFVGLYVASAVYMGFYMRWRPTDRKSTRLNSSHQIISYAVFCLKKKKILGTITATTVKLMVL